MTPESADYLDRAKKCLADAEQIAGATSLHHIAARETYLAAYHAAEAYVFERTRRTVKTHRGLRSEFLRLARDEPRIAREFQTFLAKAYEFKSNADYGVGPTAPSITSEDACEAIGTASRFVECIATILA
ncbi:MAG: HEPN domain-containing protein [Alphaproteobacteria bacterium]|nr:HEPN domain-containing protein [Alphaproteobacteria bacterium]